MYALNIRFDRHRVIKDINLEINKGRQLGSLDQQEQEKSTLIRQLLRDYNLTNGDIFIDGEPIENFLIEDVRNLVGYVPQSHFLFKRNVNENIIVGNERATVENVEMALRVSDFKKDLQFMSQG